MALTLAQLKEKIGPVKIGLAQYNQLMNGAKFGSDEYNNAKKQYQASLKLLKDYQAQITAFETAAKNKDAAAKKKADEAKAAEKAQRAADVAGNTAPKYGPKGESLVPGTPEYDKGTFTRPTTPVKTAAEIKAEQDAATAAKAKADAAAKAKADAAAKAASDKAAAAKAAADKVVSEKELALKTMYVDFLRSTFAGLDDKKQKAEIDALFDKASKEGWTSEIFQQQLEGTAWWQTTLPSLRSWYLNTHDPRKQSTTVELIRNKVASVSSYLEQLGITVQGIDPVTGKAYDKTGYVSGIAQEAVKNGWDDNQLRDYLAGQAPIVFTGGGEIGSSLSKIRDTAYAYGVKLDPTYEKMINNSLLDSSDGRDAQYYIAEMRRQSLENPNNKAFAEALNSGRTLYEATRSYRGQMANLLEVDESNVTWDDLMAKTVDNTTGAARTFADFTKQVKTDPLWQQTRNAKETYSSTALDLAKMFGLVG
jgi:chemotaxis protein histidine kinase CheA